MEFKLRSWQEDDLDALVKHANNPLIASNLTDMFPHPYERKHGEQFIKMVTEGERHRIRCIEINGEASGAIGLHPQQDIMRKNMEMGYWLAEPYWGNGIITEAVKQMVDYGFQYWDVNRIYARPFGANKGSQRVLEKAGFTLEASFKDTIFKNGQYMDELVYAIRRPVSA